MSTVTLNHELLERLAARTCAEVPKDGIVFFGLRGALPLDISGTPFATEHKVRLVEFNHLHLRCTIGQWRPAQEKLAVFPGSTVPHQSALKSMLAGGALANMLMPGRFAYQRGVHKSGKPSGHRAFRQAMFFPVWRTRDDLDFDAEDRIDLGASADSFVFDNLHCAFQDNLDLPKFSSNGCQVVAGRPKSAALGNRPETGPWARFITQTYVEAAEQTAFTYLLFSGAELGMAASRSGELPRSLRFGSSGPWVEKVQKALQEHDFDFLGSDGKFGRDTLGAVMAFQERKFGSADGIVGQNTAAALGIDWTSAATAAPPATPSSPAPPPAPPTPVAAAAAPAAAAAVTAVGVPKDWHLAAAAITPGFEVAGDPYEGVSGDFDDMGISCGALQWNIGMKSLQPMVRSVGKAVVAAHMAKYGEPLWTACLQSTSETEALRIVRFWQKNRKLVPQAKAELRALMGSAEMRAKQDELIGEVAGRALRLATNWAAAGGEPKPSKRQFLWFFDLATQNGSLKTVTRQQVRDFIARNGASGSDDLICDFLANMTGTSGHVTDANRNAALWRDQPDDEQLDLLVLTYLRSALGVREWRHVVINRKGSIAMGEGWVNGTKWDFSKYGI